MASDTVNNEELKRLLQEEEDRKDPLGLLTDADVI